MQEILFLGLVQTTRKIDFCNEKVIDDVPPSRQAEWISDQSAYFSR
jgi:hypothetical protein